MDFTFLDHENHTGSNETEFKPGYKASQPLTIMGL